MADTIGAKRRSRTTLIAVTVGVVVAGSLVAYGFSRSDDDRPGTETPPTIGVIQSPADVLTTQDVVTPSGSGPATVDVPLVPTGTDDIAVPPLLPAATSP